MSNVKKQFEHNVKPSDGDGDFEDDVADEYSEKEFFSNAFSRAVADRPQPQDVHFGRKVPKQEENSVFARLEQTVKKPTDQEGWFDAIKFNGQDAQSKYTRLTF